jgi:hypothetical protein
MAQALMLQTASPEAMSRNLPAVAETPPISETERQEYRHACEAIVGRLARLASEEVTLRAPIEKRWLDNLRAYHGRYDDITEKNLTESNGQRSRAFIKLSRAKADAWEARLSDMLFPADDRNWGIRPTPVPTLVADAREVVRQIEQAVQKANRASELQGQAFEQGDMQMAGRAAAAHDGWRNTAEAYAERARGLHTEMDEARKRSDGMQRVMEDQLVECLYPKRCRDVISDMVRLGPGILKGPLTANRASRKWSELEPGVFQLNSQPDPKPNFTRVDPWNFFPESSATSMEDCEYTLERHLPSKKELRRLGQLLNFDVDAIRRLIQNGPQLGVDTNTNHIAQIRAITGEGQSIKGRYVMWEYHGPLERDEISNMLRAQGRDEAADRIDNDDDPFEERMVRVFFCDGELLALMEDYPLDSGESLYSVVSFQRGEASILGAVGVPEILSDTQRALNGGWRMMLDNGGMSAIPQIVINKNVVEPEDGDWTIRPGKTWKKKTADVSPNDRAFETHDIPMNQAQIAGIIQLAREFADEECALPLIAQGDQGSNVTDTMGGMAILTNAANIIFRRVVKNWDDDLTTPSIRRLYDWNMQFNPNSDIKGDMNVDARGTSVLLVKELQSQNLLLITQNWTAHPTLGAMLKSGGYHAARMTVQAMNIPPDEIFLTEEEYVQKLKEIEDSQANQQTPEMITAQAHLEAAKINADSRRETAKIGQDTQMMVMAEKYNLTVEQLQARLQETHIKTDSDERKFAAEAAIEQDNAERARSEGEEPTGSGGYISAGVKDA